MFDDLAHTAGKLVVRKCAQNGHVRVYKFRHMEGADHIFVGIKINPRLSADPGVHLG